jgi:hypothetical protein
MGGGRQRAPGRVGAAGREPASVEPAARVRGSAHCFRGSAGAGRPAAPVEQQLGDLDAAHTVGDGVMETQRDR